MILCNKKTKFDGFSRFSVTGRNPSKAYFPFLNLKIQLSFVILVNIIRWGMRNNAILVLSRKQLKYKKREILINAYESVLWKPMLKF